MANQRVQTAVSAKPGQITAGILKVLAYIAAIYFSFLHPELSMLVMLLLLAVSLLLLAFGVVVLWLGKPGFVNFGK